MSKKKRTLVDKFKFHLGVSDSDKAQLEQFIRGLNKKEALKLRQYINGSGNFKEVSTNA